MNVPPDLIGDAYENSVAWTVLESLTDIGNRMAGQSGEAEGAKLLETWFDELGFREVNVSEFPVPGWWRGESSLLVEANREWCFTKDYELIALPGSPSGSVSGPIVDVGAGSPASFDAEDISDAIVLVSIETPEESDRWIHRTEKYARAVEGGAGGFLFYNEIPGCLPPTGNIGSDKPGKIPAAGLSQELGYRLVRACDAHPVVGGSLTVHAESGPSTSRNIEAVIGPETDREILLMAHVDAHDITEGATDNGVGCALVTEVGRLLDAHADELGTTVRLLVVGSEEIGLRGAHRWAETHDTDRVKCVVNIDGNGTWEDVTVYTHAFDGLTEAFSAIDDALKPSMTVDDGYLPHSDHWPFVQRGVPGAMIRSESTTGRGWGHTHADTLDKLDPKPLRELAIGIAAGINNLTDSELTIDHHPVERVQSALTESGDAIGMRAAGGWPFDDA